MVVDDHPLVRAGLVAMLEHDGIDVVGEAARVGEVADVAATCRPDVVVLDVRLPDGDGWLACEHLRSRGIGARVVMLTQLVTERVITAAFEAGASGFVVKASETEVIRRAIHTVMGGETFLDPRVTERVASLVAKARDQRGPYGLTPAEMRVVALLSDGLTNQEIGDRLGLSPETVKTHLRHARDKVGVRDRAQLAVMVMREGIA